VAEVSAVGVVGGKWVASAGRIGSLRPVDRAQQDVCGGRAAHLARYHISRIALRPTPMASAPRRRIETTIVSGGGGDARSARLVTGQLQPVPGCCRPVAALGAFVIGEMITLRAVRAAAAAASIDCAWLSGVPSVAVNVSAASWRHPEVEMDLLTGLSVRIGTCCRVSLAGSCEREAS